MAKIPKVKKREVSFHSRAARRNASPPPSKDLGVVVTSTASEATEYKPWLHHVQSAGISKRKKGKALTRQQRLRQQRGLEKADANVDKLEKKVRDSKTRAKKVKGRAVDWDELNEKVGGTKGKGATTMGSGEVDNANTMDGVVVPDLEQPLTVRSGGISGVEDTEGDAGVEATESTATPLLAPEDDEIL